MCLGLSKIAPQALPRRRLRRQRLLHVLQRCVRQQLWLEGAAAISFVCVCHRGYCTKQRRTSSKSSLCLSDTGQLVAKARSKKLHGIGIARAVASLCSVHTHRSRYYKRHPQKVSVLLSLPALWRGYDPSWPEQAFQTSSFTRGRRIAFDEAADCTFLRLMVLLHRPRGLQRWLVSPLTCPTTTSETPGHMFFLHWAYIGR